MIYEFRTYRLRPRALPEFLGLFGDALPRREQFSKLAAFWYTEIGPLNEVIHVWPYENALERTRIRAEAVKAGVWPPATGHLILDMKAEVFDALPFSPALDPSDHGPFFEMRTSTLKPFSIPTMVERWKDRIAARAELSPLIGVFSSDIGGLNRWMHIWAYRSLDERDVIRKRAEEQGIWPPPEESPAMDEESKILLAAPFSPIK
ncbi:NIPSNAP family protein [Rhodoligotrophos defluvii]|uniref:NIPSNAP family protein n=1 Tax=Rhodoligotrophos defluvii TaxID=2561934 RepID=UPI0010C97394|nr:NIPSNAP family protein [Rhodoligotrophos defluvii]